MNRLLELISQGLGLEKDCLQKKLGENPTLKDQANYYPPWPDPELTLGLAVHTDLNALTVLRQTEGVKGLQVIDHGKWVGVDPLSNAFVINLGDQIQMRNTLHCNTTEFLEEFFRQDGKSGTGDFVPSIYTSEQTLGEAVAEAINLGLIASRDQVFITSKLWCNDAHPNLVIPALKKSLHNLQMEYIDLYLIHWPISGKPGKLVYPLTEEDLVPLDFKGVWAAMEESQRLGLTKSIGVSNFSSKKTENLLFFATIPPSVNQVEMNPFWQQKKLRDFCKANGVVVTAYSPLGGFGTSC
ncbi:hypothetical protein ACLB2K_042584 [Fragaria x ananassa]